MTLYDFDCGFVLPVPSDIAALFGRVRVALEAQGVTLEMRCPNGHALRDMAEDIHPLQPVAVAWQDRMLEGVGMGETVKVGHGGKESTGA